MNLKFFLYLFLSVYLLTSCNKKDLQLPLIEIDGVKEIQNHSSIWIFYELEGIDASAVLNKNNKLLNTHWIYNIDRRLPMNKIAPILEEMQQDRNKDSMHKKEGMSNCFSYANVVSENILLIKFDSISFLFQERKIRVPPTEKREKSTIYLELTNDTYYLDEDRIGTDDLLNKLSNTISLDTLSTQKIVLQYPEDLSYQNYLSAKALLSTLALQVDKNEYIYTIK